MIRPVSLAESDVVNLISVDIPNLLKAFRFLHFPWSCPLQISMALYFLYHILGAGIVPGKTVKKAMTNVTFLLKIYSLIFRHFRASLDRVPQRLHDLPNAESSKRSAEEKGRQSSADI